MLPPTIEPRVTGHLPQIIALIEQLVENGTAYVSDGDVYLTVKAVEGYGEISGHWTRSSRARRPSPHGHSGAKRDPLDFALWKAAKPGEPSWPSPWGPGRPGWHIECSAMAVEYLGDQFDLHAGGLDLVFPHHENEIAQSTCAGHPFARLWLHHGLVTAAGGEKMSKSLGNCVTVEPSPRDRRPAGAALWPRRRPLPLDDRVVGPGRRRGRGGVRADRDLRPQRHGRGRSSRRSTRR